MVNIDWTFEFCTGCDNEALCAELHEPCPEVSKAIIKMAKRILKERKDYASNTY